MNHSNHRQKIPNKNEYNHRGKIPNGNGSNPCTDKLTNIEYLEHMIPHHQVAIDMSNLLAKKSQNPSMLHMCRDITRKQSYEIWEMTMMKQNLTDTIFSPKKWSIDNKSTTLDRYNPIMSKSKDGNCNPLFFKPNDHSKMMNNMEITDRSYLEHHGSGPSSCVTVRVDIHKDMYCNGSTHALCTSLGRTQIASGKSPFL